MKGFLSSLAQLIWFGSLTAMVVLEGALHPLAVVALFVVGDMFVTGILCSLIIRQFHNESLPEWLILAVVGFFSSHVCILLLLHAGPFNSEGPPISAASTLGWMEITLRVGLVVVLATAAGVLYQRRIRRFTESQIRRFTASA
jgi:hypothetical protein